MAEREHQGVAGKQLRVEAQLQKEPVVVFTHTVVYPGTVVVHPPHAVATAAAVVGALRPHQVTLVAQLPQLPLCMWDLGIFRESSRIS